MNRVEKFNEYVKESGGNIEDFVSNQIEAVEELFSKGTSEFIINERIYRFEISVSEIRDNL